MSIWPFGDLHGLSSSAQYCRAPGLPPTAATGRSKCSDHRRLEARNPRSHLAFFCTRKWIGRIMQPRRPTRQGLTNPLARAVVGIRRQNMHHFLSLWLAVTSSRQTLSRALYRATTALQKPSLLDAQSEAHTPHSGVKYSSGQRSLLQEVSRPMAGAWYLTVLSRRRDGFQIERWDIIPAVVIVSAGNPIMVAH